MKSEPKLKGILNSLYPKKKITSILSPRVMKDSPNFFVGIIGILGKVGILLHH